MGRVPSWALFAFEGSHSSLAATLTAPLQALKLWAINLLPTWGRLMYQGWVSGEDQQGGSSGLLVTRPVRELLYGALPVGGVGWCCERGLGVPVGWRWVAGQLHNCCLCNAAPCCA